MAATYPVWGNVWPSTKKPVDAGVQPCSDTWRLETRYSDPSVLMHNWYEDRAVKNHEKYRHLTAYRNVRQGKVNHNSSHHITDQSEYMDSYRHPKNRELPRCYRSIESHRSMPSPHEIFMKILDNQSANRTDMGTQDTTQSSKLPAVCGFRTNESQQLPQLASNQELGQSQEPRLPKTVYQPNSACMDRGPTTRDQYSLLEKALEHTNRINQQYQCKDTLRSSNRDYRDSQQIQDNILTRPPLKTCANKMLNLCKETYPVSYNKRINWIKPEYKTSCHTTCQ